MSLSTAGSRAGAIAGKVVDVRVTHRGIPFTRGSAWSAHLQQPKASTPARQGAQATDSVAVGRRMPEPLAHTSERVWQAPAGSGVEAARRHLLETVDASLESLKAHPWRAPFKYPTGGTYVSARVRGDGARTTQLEAMIPRTANDEAGKATREAAQAYIDAVQKTPESFRTSSAAEALLRSVRGW